MASSPVEPGERLAQAVADADAVAFALRELTACWDQAYAALGRGDLEGVGALLDVAQDHVAAAGDPSGDTSGVTNGDDVQRARLRADAAAARDRLEQGMRAGLDAIAEDLSRARAGGKALRGYAQLGTGVGERVTRDA